MSTLHKTGRAVLLGFVVPLVATLVLASGRASGAASATDAARARHIEITSAPTGIFACVLENGKPGSIVVYPDPFGHGPCEIAGAELPGSSRLFCNEGVCPTCRELQRRWDCPLM